MKCPKCQASNPPNAKYCLECGNKLAQIDKSRPLTYTPRFLADKILTTRSAMEGERKIVTVLFLDVVDSTRIFENMDPEEVHDIMDGCFKIAMDDIHKFEGTINQFRGDGVMALFGAPIAHEDDAHRACSAAISIQKKIEAYSQKVRPIVREDFKVRIGLNSGQVVVGSIGQDLRMDYTADGDTVNLASRLENRAEPGTILVSDAIVDRVRADFKFKDLGRVKIKGKEKRQNIYRLIDHTDGQRPLPRRMIFSNMVGRERELNRLELRVLKAKNGEGSIVNIIGEAGVGKSRLMAEQVKRDTIQDTVVLEGRAHAMGRNLSFHPIIEIIKNWADIHDKDIESVAVHKLRSAIQQVHPQQADQIFPFVARMMGLMLSGDHARRLEGIEGEALEVLINKSLRDLILKASEISTLIFVIEDVHWADESSIELMIKLFRMAADHRILFINIFRPHYKDTGDKLLDAVIENYPDLHTEIYVQPLDATNCNLLIANLLEDEGLPHDVRDLIHLRSEGNPFFIEEVVRSFIDQGLVTQQNGRFKIAGEIKAALIPNTIQELIMSRLDKLDDQTKLVLKIAAVIGRNFFHKLLVDVADAVDHIDRHLKFLQSVELIRESRRMGEIEYIFSHALVLSTAYKSILRQTRKELHLRVAVCAERLYEDKLHEFYGMLAYHYSSAEDPEKAEHYLVKAGQEALRSSASSEALNYYKEAFDIYQLNYGKTAEPEKVAMFDKNIALALYNRGQYEESVNYFEKSLDYFWGKLPRHPVNVFFKFVSGFNHFLVALFLPFLKFGREPSPEIISAIDLYYRKCKALIMIDPKRFFIESFYFLRKVASYKYTAFREGIVLFVGASALFSFTGISFRLSAKILDFARDKIDTSNARQVITFDLLETTHHALEGNWDRIAPYDETIADRNIEMGEVWLTSQYIYWKGIYTICRGDIDTANKMVDRLMEIGLIYENDLSRLFYLLLSTYMLIEIGRFEDAAEKVEESIDFIKKSGPQVALIDMYSMKAILCIEKDNLQEAHKNIQLAETVIPDSNAVPSQIGEYYLALCEYYLRLLRRPSEEKQPEEEKDFQTKGFNAAKKFIKNAKYAAHNLPKAYSVMGNLHWVKGRQGKALTWWNKAIRECERMDAQLSLAKCFLNIGCHLSREESRHEEFNKVSAAEYLEKAEKLYEGLGLDWDGAKVESLIKE